MDESASNTFTPQGNYDKFTKNMSKGRKIKKMDRFLQGGSEQQPDGFYDSDSDEEQEENPSTGETDSN